MKKKVIHAVTIPDSLWFMEGQLKYLESSGYEVKAMSTEGKEAVKFSRSEGIEILKVDMEREISLFKDFKSLISCIRIFQKEKPLIVNASTPKAGLIVTLAAYICGVPIRIYTIRGLRAETTKGLKRQILLTAEKIAARSATHCLAVSESLKKRVVEFGIANEEKILILGKGSGDGFHVERFQKTDDQDRKAKGQRCKYGLTNEHTVLGFTGRLTKDKGINELVAVFLKLHEKHKNLRLLIVGDYDTADAVEDKTQKEIEENPNIIHTGFQDDPVGFFHMMDIFVFLTKREGFGNVSIEAALTGIPVIASDVTGARDTIVDEKTGFLVDPLNLNDISEKLELLILSPELCNKLGQNGRQWAIGNFSNDLIWKEMDRFYENCLAERLTSAGENPQIESLVKKIGSRGNL